MNFTNAHRLAALLLVMNFFNFCLGAAYTPPSKALKFRSVLARAKLQSPYGWKSVKNLMGYASRNFQLTDLKFMQFRISGRKRRTELRQMTRSGTEVSWSVNDPHRMRAVVAIPEQEPRMERFMFMQVLCARPSGDGVPAVKIYWSNKTRGGKHLVEVGIRDGAGDGDSTNYDLTYIDYGRSEFIIDIDKTKLNIYHDGVNVMQDMTLEFFAKNKYGCYFKAGVYGPKPEDRSAYARSKFFELEW